ncbi:MAG: hypothetical protein GOMPHAMPRED_006525 [Gomphillus americanus]|uniref:Uncharacterized protein n=1 Tax=Gomphillus americanus TaxID=1940652 RepID=A0A8H3ISY8_9LECA|nr:MAG: hypothetical protein GOMPHAMPRED_006525 [Gomphillus americanus]
MPPTTRSQGQTTGSSPGGKANKLPAKRKAPEAFATASRKKSKPATNKADSEDKKKPSKDPNESKVEHESEDGKDRSITERGEITDADENIIINRAPVLELWSACVTSFLHSHLSWATCLSVGSAISSLAAISKGRSIGAISQPDPSAQAEKRDKRASMQKDMDEVHIMTFSVKLKDGSALVGDKPKKGNEETIRKKYGGSYDKVKKAMQNTLQDWQGKQEELNSRAFHMYEDFRPSVAAGQKGWGRKGKLSLDTLRRSTAMV